VPRSTTLTTGDLERSRDFTQRASPAISATPFSDVDLDKAPAVRAEPGPWNYAVRSST